MLSSVSTLNALEAKLDQLLQEFRSGNRESSNFTQDSLSVDEKQTWSDIRKELEDVGLTLTAFELNKDLITKKDTSECSDIARVNEILKEAAREDKSLIGSDGDADPALPSQQSVKILEEPKEQENNTLRPHDTDSSQSRASKLPLLRFRISGSNKALISAANKRATATVSSLLAKGANIGYRASIVEDSALCSAIKADQREIIRILMKHVADLCNKEGQDWQTPLTCGARYSSVDTMRYLLDSGANVNGSPLEWSTSLNVAASLNNINMVSLLLQYGANVNSVSRSGHSPLMFAIFARGSRFRKESTIKEQAVTQGSNLRNRLRGRLKREFHNFNGGFWRLCSARRFFEKTRY